MTEHEIVERVYAEWGPKQDVFKFDAPEAWRCQSCAATAEVPIAIPHLSNCLWRAAEAVLGIELAPGIS